MGRFLLLTLMLIAAAACSRTEDNILRDKTLGAGEAFCITAAGDTGIICGGTIGGKPYIAFLDKKLNKLSEYSPGINGTITSLVTSDDRIIAAGSSEGMMFIAVVDFSGNTLGDTLIQSGFTVGHTSLCPTGSGSFMALGSSADDTIRSVPYGLAFREVNNKGEVLKSFDTIPGSFIKAGNICCDNAGNYYIALSRIGTGGKIKATVASFDQMLRNIWETELYNNPEFGASSLDIAAGSSGDIFVSGFTEFSVNNGTGRNAFAAAIGQRGQIKWKRYLEFTNSAVSQFENAAGTLYVLNSAC
ncbi:MAG: hypothetical protein GYA43_04735, partial [Bacteroidales bacterium]|nr:hypothetical protein [Bacteroidales bacterium]